MSTSTRKNLKKPVAPAKPEGIRNAAVPAGSAFAPPSYEAVFERLRNLVRHLCNGRLSSGGILVTGTAGVSKSTTVLQILEEEVAKPEAGFEYEMHRGHCSALGLYSILNSANEAAKGGKRRILLFDDFDGILGMQNTAKSVLAPLTEKRIVSFQSTRRPPGLPDRIELQNVQVIIVTNISTADAKSEHMRAVLSRCHVVDVHLTPAQIIEMIACKLVPASFGDSTLDDRRYVFSRLRSAATHSATAITLRMFHQLLELHMLGEDLTLHLEQLLPSSPELHALRSALEKADTVEEAAALWSRTTGKSVRSFYYQKRRWGEWL